jgi:hypothetical protein
MKNSMHEGDVREFISWLKKEYDKHENDVFSPSPELRELAWQAAQANRRFLLDNGLYIERIMPLAAADGSQKEAPLEIEILGGDYTLTRQIIPQDSDWVNYLIKCRQELIAKNLGRKINVLIDDYEIDFEIDEDGEANAEVPSNLDFEKIIIKPGKLNKPE